MGRVTGLLVGALLMLTLVGCGADGGAGDSSTGVAQGGPDVRERLATGLAATNPNDADLIERASTTLTPVEAPWLRGWQVFDVYWQQSSSSHRFYAALSDDGTALVLSGDPDSFAQMTRSAQVVVDEAAVAADVGAFYLDVTRDFSKWSYRIDSVSDIEWPELNPVEEQQVAEFEAQYDAMVQPPVAELSDTGWSVTAWAIYDRSLVRHRLEVARDGAVQDSSEEVAADLLLPQSL